MEVSVEPKHDTVFKIIYCDHCLIHFYIPKEMDDNVEEVFCPSCGRSIDTFLTDYKRLKRACLNIQSQRKGGD